MWQKWRGVGSRGVPVSRWEVGGMSDACGVSVCYRNGRVHFGALEGGFETVSQVELSYRYTVLSAQ